MSSGINLTCAHCGRPMLQAVWSNGSSYHLECLHGPNWTPGTYTAPLAAPLTVEDVRRVIREELARAKDTP